MCEPGVVMVDLSDSPGMVRWRIVGPSRGLGRRPGLEGCAEEKFLELVELPLEHDDV